MKKLFVLIALVLGCASIQTHASTVYVSNYINQTLGNVTHNPNLNPILENFMHQTIDVYIYAGDCASHSGSLGPGQQNGWSIGDICKVQTRVTLPNKKVFTLSTDGDIFIETFVSNGKYWARWKYSDGDWHAYDLTNDANAPQ